jgi:hypothetical protein
MAVMDVRIFHIYIYHIYISIIYILHIYIYIYILNVDAGQHTFLSRS